MVEENPYQRQNAIRSKNPIIDEEEDEDDSRAVFNALRKVKSEKFEDEEDSEIQSEVDESGLTDSDGDISDEEEKQRLLEDKNDRISQMRMNKVTSGTLQIDE